MSANPRYYIPASPTSGGDKNCLVGVSLLVKLIVSVTTTDTVHNNDIKRGIQ